MAIQTSGEKHLEAYRLLEDSPYRAISVLLNRPAHNVADMLVKQGVNVQQLFFVDHVTKPIASSLEMEQNTVYGEDGFTLANMDALVQQVVHMTNKERKLLFFDALHDLYHYYPEQTILRFLDYFLDRARILRLNPVFLYDRRKITASVAKKLGEVCDQVVKL